MAPGVLEAAQRIVDKWKLDGIIEPSDSDYISVPVMVRKSDDTYRMCIDVNARTVPTVRDCTPSKDTVLDGLRGARAQVIGALKDACRSLVLGRICTERNSWRLASGLIRINVNSVALKCDISAICSMRRVYGLTLTALCLS